jgi:hypothetical protein
MEEEKKNEESADVGSNEEAREEREDRADQANEFCGDECRKNRMKVSSWKDFTAWKEYVDGKISDTQLAEKAKMEIAEFSRVFGKYIVIEKAEDKHSDEEEEKKKRAKRANKIYREVCAETNLNVCFFHGFISWSDYVEGRITESEFYERARAEIKQMAESSQT